MKTKTLSAPLLVIFLASGLVRVGPQAPVPAASPQDDASLLLPEERRHLRNVRQLTFGGQNAEAYFSADDKQLIFQASVGEGRCDQMYTMDLAGGIHRVHLVAAPLAHRGLKDELLIVSRKVGFGVLPSEGELPNVAQVPPLLGQQQARVVLGRCRRYRRLRPHAN